MNENFSISTLIEIGLTKSEAVIYLNLLKKRVSQLQKFQNFLEYLVQKLTRYYISWL